MKFNTACDMKFNKFKANTNKPLKDSEKKQFKPFQNFNKEIKKSF